MNLWYFGLMIMIMFAPSMRNTQEACLFGITLLSIRKARYVTSRYSNPLAKYDPYSIKEAIHEVSEGEYNNNSNAILQLYWCAYG